MTTQDQYFAAMTMCYHGVEKGMALPSPRPLFGKYVIAKILSMLRFYRRRFGFGQAGHAAINTLAAYVRMHDDNGWSDGYIDHLRAQVESLRQCPEFGDCEEALGGVTSVRREDILSDAKLDLTGFFASRHSVRDFSDEPVDVDLIKQAVAMAQRTPSVCNRQPWGALLLTTREAIDRVLDYQNGNRGFRSSVDKLLIVVGDTAAFVSAEERYQQWIDGGMFSMSLVYALHALGVATCCLNWNAGWSDDRRLRKELGLKGSQSVVMMIAVGNMPESFRVCHAPRKRMEDVLIIR